MNVNKSDRHRLTIRTAALVVLIGWVAVIASPTTAAPLATPMVPIQIGLGDSWAAGEGADHPSKEGYMALTYQAMRNILDCLPDQSLNTGAACPQLRLMNLGRSATESLPGVSTTALINEQLPEIIPIIEARMGDDDPRNDVELIVLSVGGNDVSRPILEACLAGFNENCISVIQARMALVAGNYQVILGSLREAVGPIQPSLSRPMTTQLPFATRGKSPERLNLASSFWKVFLDWYHKV